MKRLLKVGVAGATGAVGLKMLSVMSERGFPVESVRAMASGRGDARTVPFGSLALPVEELTANALPGLDMVLFATGASVSRQFVPIAVAGGAVAIDNSRAFRMEDGVPLVVPEVNAEAVRRHAGIIANPNCSTIQMVLALKPLQDVVGIKRVVVSTYQSVSGTGKAAIEELREQSGSTLAGEPIISRVYPHPIAFNCIPHIDVIDEDGNTREEIKMVLETRKILELPELQIAATCVRVPVFHSHALSLCVELESELAPDDARRVLGEFPGIRILDDASDAVYPTQLSSSGTDETWIGRIRRDASVTNGLWMWVVADNLRKGAALNAVQIAELLLDERSG